MAADREGRTKSQGSARALETGSWVQHVIEMKESIAKVRTGAEHAVEQLAKQEKKLEKVSDDVSSIKGSVQSVWTAATVVKWAIGVILTIVTLLVTVYGLSIRHLPDIIRALRGG